MSTAKECLIELARTLPDECTWDDVMYQIYVRQKIDAGARDLDAGRATPHEEVFQEFEQ
jgi:hypothetical protein